MIEKPSDYFWWVNILKTYVWNNFWWIILIAIVFFVPFSRVWWWFFVPVILLVKLRILYLWWVRWDYAYASTKWITLRIVPQKEAEAPLKAMEDIFAIMWSSLYDTMNWREIWFEGAYMPWMSWEIVSIEGNLYFYVYLKDSLRSTLESAIYSYFPEVEIYEVPDYVKAVPKNLPNDEFDIYGEDFVLGNKDFYPIKTYEQFFEPQGEKISAEEKRIDPLTSFLEAMAKVGPGEQVWVQFVIGSSDDANYKKSAQDAIDKMSNRAVEKPKTFWKVVQGLVRDLLLGPEKEGSGEKASYKWASHIKVSESGERELLFTPGERQTVSELENKIKKSTFKANIRGMYVAKRENWNAGNSKLPRMYFSHFQSNNNFIRYSVLTRPKTHYILRKRIPYFRNRKAFKNYAARFVPHFPDLEKETNFLNLEEMATLVHFPFKVIGVTFPTLERVEHKKAGPPSNLPIE